MEGGRRVASEGVVTVEEWNIIIARLIYSPLKSHLSTP